MSVVLYHSPMSAYCRSVLLVAKAVGVPLDRRIINVFENEQFKPEFVAINPQHTVPTLVDGDLVLWESRAILTYLVGRYGKDKTLYPDDVKVRAKVDALLYFDCGTLMQRWKAVVVPLMGGSTHTPSPESLKQLHEALSWLETMLIRHKGKFAAGTEDPTVADFALVAGMSSYEACGFFQAETYPVLGAWLERCKKVMPGYQEMAGDDAAKFAELMRSKMNKA